MRSPITSADTAALAEGRPIPNELRDEVDELRKEIDMEDDSTKGRSSLGL